MSDVTYFNTVTKKQLASIVTAQPHAILISGPAGVGKLFSAKHIVSELRIPAANVQVFHHSDEKTLGIDFARQLQSLYKMKNSTSLRAVIVEDADILSIEAQNALLKLIEEPPVGTLFILTATILDAMLGTIQSRCAQVAIMPLADSQVKDFMALYPEISAAERRQITLAGQNRMGEISKLVHDKDYRRKRLAALAEAKACVLATQYERNALLYKHTTKVQAIVFIRDILLVMNLSLAASTAKDVDTRKHTFVMTKLIAAHDAIQKNAQVKLQLDALSAAWR